jgi:hypothetical protein
VDIARGGAGLGTVKHLERAGDPGAVKNIHGGLQMDLPPKKMDHF